MTVVKIKKEQKEIYKNPQNSFADENQLLKSSLNYLKTELNKFKEVPLLVSEVKKIIGNKAVIKVPNGSHFLVNVSSNITLSTGDTVLVEQRSLTIVQKIDEFRALELEDFVIIEKPNISWGDVGGLDKQINEIREVVELPLLKPQLFVDVGIDPPKGILLHGPPGTGKTLLAKAVATSANSTFIELVGSELVQKFIGEGAKLVRDLFKMAKEKAPSIIFIDELDAIAAQRVDLGTSGEREVQRTFMQLLTEIDGFNGLDKVKIIAATNRFDILDPAVLRPGRFDRLIEVPLPDEQASLNILRIHSKKMNLDNVDFQKLMNVATGLSGAEIRSICTEAGYFAIRKNKTSVSHQDFINAIDKVKNISETDQEFIGMFG